MVLVNDIDLYFTNCKSNSFVSLLFIIDFDYPLI